MREIGPFVDSATTAVLAVLGGRRARPQERHARPAHSPRARTCSAASPRPPTSWSRTSGPARSSSGTSAPTDLDPTLVTVRISMFGQDGPYSRAARASTASASATAACCTSPAIPTARRCASASRSPTTSPACSPRRPRSAALYARDARGGTGAVIDAALYGAVLRILEWTLAGVRPARHRAQPRGQPARELRAARQLPHRATASTSASSPAPTRTSPGCARRWSGPTCSTTRASPSSPTAPRAATRSTASSPTGPRRSTRREIEAALRRARRAGRDRVHRGRHLRRPAHGRAAATSSPSTTRSIGPVRQQAPFPRFVGEPADARRRGAPRSAQHTHEVLRDAARPLRRPSSTRSRAKGVV